MPLHNSWRDFVYCYTVIGKHLCRIDHFDNKTTPITFWEHTPTAVAHLPQNKFEDILRKYIVQDNNSTLYGTEVIDINYRNKTNNMKTEVIYHTIKNNNNNKNNKNNKNNSSNNNNRTKITCDYLIGADGSNSFTRKKINISMIGDDSLQTLVNVHFKCKGLDKFLKPRPAMLYFSFNEHMVSVFVAHDPMNDEWVCQIPIFPPFQTIEEYTKEKLLSLLSSSLGLNSIDNNNNNNNNNNNIPTIEIININHWTMQSQVAESFQGYSNNNNNSNNNNSNKSNIFLVGDCAHRFPPSGGFGMNTGIVINFITIIIIIIIIITNFNTAVIIIITIIIIISSSSSSSSSNGRSGEI
jgi:2-polyprenyl-6-methoxyphenol hydroxylase-like FAD-dependent oxidoreductase